MRCYYCTIMFNNGRIDKHLIEFQLPVTVCMRAQYIRVCASSVTAQSDPISEDELNYAKQEARSDDWLAREAKAA